MFTGLVEGSGRLAQLRAHGGGLRLVVRHALSGERLVRGESIAVDGCCLTVVSPGKGSFEADLSPETLARTGARRRWVVGREVNLERALRVGDRLGGHLLQGHADGVARLLAVDRLADGSRRLRVELASGARALVVEKGSIALDGVSLTVATCSAKAFELAVIPATLDATTLHQRRVGDELIIEYDLLGKYVAAALRVRDERA